MNFLSKNIKQIQIHRVLHRLTRYSNFNDIELFKLATSFTKDYEFDLAIDILLTQASINDKGFYRVLNEKLKSIAEAEDSSDYLDDIEDINETMVEILNNYNGNVEELIQEVLDQHKKTLYEYDFIRYGKKDLLDEYKIHLDCMQNLLQEKQAKKLLGKDNYKNIDQEEISDDIFIDKLDSYKEFFGGFSSDNANAVLYDNTRKQEKTRALEDMFGNSSLRYEEQLPSLLGRKEYMSQESLETLVKQLDEVEEKPFDTTKRDKFLRLSATKKHLLTCLEKKGSPQLFFLNNSGYSYTILKFFLEKSTRNIGFQTNISLLDLCMNLNCIIPHYCYHFNLSIAGNCRMCLIELTTSQKPIASCAIDLSPNQHSLTNTFLVKRAREGIMEFLLVNHPLDCPVCDQGGECDLQDQSLIYGSDRGRFYKFSDFKRSVTDFFFNSMIKVNLTRCIHCTRCVRFLSEIEGDNSLGMLGRGNNSEIGLYSDSIPVTELGSNITDFCPVGALTVKEYALNYRSWEDLYFESIDLSDSLCTSIRVYSDLSRIIRLLPQYNTELEITWITEKTRYLTDSLNSQYFNYPQVIFKSSMVDDLINFKSRTFSWNKLSKLLFISLKQLQRNFVFKTFVGNFLDLFTLVQLKEFNMSMGYNSIYSFSEKLLFSSTKFINEDFDSNYIFKALDLTPFKQFFFINLNLRFENPILNAKVRHKKLWTTKTQIFYIGPKYNLAYKYIHLGTTTKLLLKIIEGRHYLFNFLNRNVNQNNTTLLLYGSELFKLYKNFFYRSFLNYLKRLNNLLQVNYLVTEASTMSTFDLALDRFVTKTPMYQNEKCNLNGSLHYYVGLNQPLLGANFSLQKSRLIHKVSIFQNSFFDQYYNFVDFFLPSISHYEAENEYYINCFGILKMTQQTFLPEDKIVRDNMDLIFFLFSLLQKVFTDISSIKVTPLTAIFSYVPVHLYDKRRLVFFVFVEKIVFYSVIYFYLLSSKTKNFFKTSIFTYYSKNMNLLSNQFFFKKTNYSL